MTLFEIIAEPEVVEFLHGLNATDRARADFAASLLAEYGTTSSEPYCKSLGDGVRELRFMISSGQAIRITYWFPDGPLAILLTVFTKSRQRETREVERAKLAKKICENEHDRTWHNVFHPIRQGQVHDAQFTGPPAALPRERHDRGQRYGSNAERIRPA